MPNTTVTLRPSAIVSNVTWAATGGTADAVLADNSDASYDASSVDGDLLTLDLGTFAFPALAVILDVQVRRRVAQVSGSSDLLIRLGVGTGPLLQVGGTSVGTAGGAPATSSGGNSTTTPTGGVWQQADIDALRLQLEHDTHGGAGVMRVYEMYVDVVYNQAPVAVVTGPTGTINTPTPVVTWTYSDPDGDAQQRYSVRVFPSSAYSAVGFSPDDLTYTWNSPDVASSTTSATVGVSLPPGTYKAYVKVADGVGGRDPSNFGYGVWAAGPAFSVVVDLPAVPVVASVTPDPTLNRVGVGLEGRDNELTRNQAGIEAGAQGWYAMTNMATPTRSTAQFLNGASSLSLSSTGAGATMQARSAAAVTLAGLQAEGNPVLAGAQYGALASLRAAVSVRLVTVQIDWYTAAAAYVSTTTGARVATSTTGWIQAYAAGVAPPTAAWAVVVVTVTSPAGAAEVQYLDSVKFGPVSAAGINRLTTNESSIETDATGWSAGTNTPTVARTTGQFLDGAAALSLTAAGVGGMSVLLAAPEAVTVGRSFTARAWFKTAVTARSVRVDILWLNAASTVIATTTGSVVTDATAVWTEASAVGVAPALAVYARPELVVVTTAAAEIHYIDVVTLAETADVTWSRGGGVLNLGAASDAFTRADNAASLGTADVGGAWTAHVGTWGIIGGKAYLASTTLAAIATLQRAPFADGTLTVDITTGTGPNRTDVGVILRAVDGTNALIVRLNKLVGSINRVDILKYVAGVATQLATNDAAQLLDATTYGVKVEFFAGSIRVYLNRNDGAGYVLLVETALSSADITTFGTTANTRYGLYMSAAAASDDGTSRFDNFVLTGPPSQRVYLERSDDGGTTWVKVRGVNGVDLTDPAQRNTWYDYEAPRDKAAMYRAKESLTEGLVVTETGYSETLTMSTALASDGTFWLKSPTDPTKSIQFLSLNSGMSSTSTEKLTVFEALNRADPIIHGDTIRLEVFDPLDIAFLNDAAWDAFEILRRRQEPLLLQTCYGDDGLDQFWVRLGPNRDVIRVTNDQMATAQLRRVRIKAYEVLIPVVP